VCHFHSNYSRDLHPAKWALGPAGLFADTSDGVVIVDTGNYYPRQRDGRIEAIEAGLPESRWVEQQLGRPVIKAFNNIYARHLLELGRPAGAPGCIT
jgi:8-hydroxy-5-deazaflavin:NADPH oxidoreductase